MNFYDANYNIQMDPVFLENIKWGKPRSGHDEGTIHAHIDELCRNLEEVNGDDISDEDKNKLLFLILVHDTFKKDATPGSSIEDPKSHASLAVEYAKKYTDDKDILTIIQYHDLNFSLAQSAQKNNGSYSVGRLLGLLGKLSLDGIRLLLIFTYIDGWTPGKDHSKLDWFKTEVLKYRPLVRWNEEWVKAFKD